MKRKLGLLPTPRAMSNRAGRGAMVENRQWSAPSLEQVAELAAGILPREFDSPDELPGRSRRMLPTPTSADGKGGGRNPDTWERAKRESGGGCSNLRDATRSLLPTPTSSDATSGGSEQRTGSLWGAAKLLPTPRASTGGTDFAREDRDESGGDDLGTAMVKMALLPTPSAEESQPTDEYIEEMRAAGIQPDERLYLPGRKWHAQRTLSRVVPAMSSGASTEPQSTGGKSSSGGLRLNPSFVEWMMGAPHGWTDPDCPLSATEFSCKPDGSAADGSSNTPREAE